MRRILLLVFLYLTLTPFTPIWAGDTEFVQIPPTVFGPSGLLFTQSIDTLDPGNIAIGVGFAHERGSGSDFKLDELSSTLTVGLPGRIELAARAPYLIRVETDGEQDNSLRDIDLTIKWRFLSPSAEYNFPGFGLSLSYFFPAGDEALRLVDSWGIKALLVSSAETEVGRPHGILVGFYADGGVFLRDLDKPTEEKHGLLNLGLLIPATESNQLHVLLEFNATFKNNIPFEGNYTAATGGLRYVTPHANLTGGIQHRFQRESEIPDTNRFVIQASYLF